MPVDSYKKYLVIYIYIYILIRDLNMEPSAQEVAILFV
jgi:hypothetical protein